jgi:hypothetical protein
VIAGCVAQLAEHSALNRQVVGSIPTAPTNILFRRFTTIKYPLAILSEMSLIVAIKLMQSKDPYTSIQGLKEIAANVRGRGEDPRN